MTEAEPSPRSHPAIIMRTLLLLAALLARPTWSLQTTRPPSNVRLVILPGFGNDSSDYTPPGSLVSSLEARGWKDIAVLDVKRLDWLQVFVNGLFDPLFWAGNMPPTRPSFAWYLDRIRNEIERSEDKVVLVAHSAGGWLARAALGFLGLDNRVLGLVSLGAPHLPPPPTVMDMTRGALRITHETFPGSYHKNMFYITVIGNSVTGVEQERKAPWEPTSVSGFAFNSYEAVCGIGSALGDGVVPLCAAHLDDSVALELPGVYHSINAPDQWYGSNGVLDQWHDSLVAELQTTLTEQS